MSFKTREKFPHAPQDAWGPWSEFSELVEAEKDRQARLDRARDDGEAIVVELRATASGASVLRYSDGGADPYTKARYGKVGANVEKPHRHAKGRKR